MVIGMRAVLFAALMTANVAFAQEETVVVTVDGFGANEVEARNSCWEKAVTQVVGAYVQAERKVVNDSLKEEIIKFSDGYVLDSKEVSREVDSTGGVSLTMEVTVKKGKVFGDIHEGKVAVIDITAVPPDKRKTVAAKLLLKAFENYPMCVMDTNIQGLEQGEGVSVTSESSQITTRDLFRTNEGESFMNFNVVLSVNREKYFAFVKKIKPWLEAVDEVKNPRELEFAITMKPGESFDVSVFKMFRMKDQKMFRMEDQDQRLSVCLNMNSAGTQSRWRNYNLGKTAGEIVVLIIKNLQSSSVEFLDGEGNVVIAKTFRCISETGRERFKMMVPGASGLAIEDGYYPQMLSPYVFHVHDFYENGENVFGKSYSIHRIINTPFLSSSYPFTDPVFQDEIDQVTSVRVNLSAIPHE